MHKIPSGSDTLIFKSTHEGLVQIPTNTLNRATLFGDGVFETMVYIRGKIRFAPEHENRLNLGLSLLKIRPFLLSIRELEDYLRMHFNENVSLRIRWNVYRGGLGKYTPHTDHAEDLVLIQNLETYNKIKPKAFICKNIRITPSPWSQCKTLNSLAYVMANIERVERGMDEVILLSDKGFISETGASNIFWIKDAVYYTPSLSSNCIAGVGRRKILELLKDQKTQVREGEYLPEDLLAAEQIFTSNATGITYISSLENRTYQTTALPLLEGLFE